MRKGPMRIKTMTGQSHGNAYDYEKSEWIVRFSSHSDRIF